VWILWIHDAFLDFTEKKINKKKNKKNPAKSVFAFRNPDLDFLKKRTLRFFS